MQKLRICHINKNNKNIHEFFSHSKYHPISKIFFNSSKYTKTIIIFKKRSYHMWDSSADHKHNTVLLFFEDAVDPLGPAASFITLHSFNFVPGCQAIKLFKAALK